jgi:3-deoxy-D-arabino-heptulosonate 7-phosphate (DAHP) synthase
LTEYHYYCLKTEDYEAAGEQRAAGNQEAGLRAARDARVVIGAIGAEKKNPSLVTLMSWPQVESEQQLMATAHAMRKAGATILRGGVKRWRAANHARRFQETHARAEALHQGGQSELGVKRKLTNPRGPSHWSLHHGAGKSFPQ